MSESSEALHFKLINLFKSDVFLFVYAITFYENEINEKI